MQFRRVIRGAAVAGILAVPTTSVANASVEGNMKAECKGAAAGLYSIRPVYVKVGPVWPASDGFAIEGSADLGDQGSKHFNCTFDKHRKFKQVMPLDSDGE